MSVIYPPYHCDNDFGILRFTEKKMHQTTATIQRPKLDHVRRNLFGPVDRKECSRFAEEELAKHQLSASQKWGFDFVRGCPLEDTKLFVWERVPSSNEIPEMYTLSRAAHIRPIDPERTPSKKRKHQRRDSYLDLYDDLADGINSYNSNGKLNLSYEDVDDGHTSASSDEEEEEESFEEEEDEHLLGDLSWMPSTSKIPSSSSSSSSSSATVNVSGAGNSSTSTSSSDATSTIRSNCDSICNRDNLSQLCTIVPKSTSPIRNIPRVREKRQCKMTDFLKERKRLQPAIKKDVSPKRPRITSPNGTIKSYFSSKRQSSA